MIAAGYLVVSLALGQILPHVVPALHETQPLIVAVVLALFAAGVHWALARGRWLAWVEAEIKGMRERLTYLEAEIRTLRAEQAKSGSGAMVAEMRVLQSQLALLAQKRPAASMPAVEDKTGSK
ncbi:MAG: hypothetical protein FJX52_06265, partial [Alphaproteobacteria bacterium]|nr:hypothetical protein [Alphaproteobacteria bacterium]